MFRRLHSAKLKKPAQAAVDVLLTVDEQRDLAAQIEPRRVDTPQLTGFQFRLDRRSGDAGQSYAAHDGSFDRADAAQLDWDMQHPEFAFNGVLENGARARPFFAQHPARSGQRSGISPAPGQRMLWSAQQ